MPPQLEEQRNVTIDDVRAFFLRRLVTPEELSTLDEEFRAKFTELGFRL